MFFETIMVQEQYAFVLNRNGNKKNPVDEVMIRKAEEVLRNLEVQGKASSETYGIWGRIYKDRFDRAYKQGNMAEAKAHLKNALKYYLKYLQAVLATVYVPSHQLFCNL